MIYSSPGLGAATVSNDSAASHDSHNVGTVNRGGSPTSDKSSDSVTSGIPQSQEDIQANTQTAQYEDQGAISKPSTMYDFVNDYAKGRTEITRQAKEKRFDGKRAESALDKLIGRKKKAEDQVADSKKIFVNIVDESELDAEIAKAKAELSKLNYNHTIEPKVYNKNRDTLVSLRTESYNEVNVSPADNVSPINQSIQQLPESMQGNDAADQGKYPAGEREYSGPKLLQMVKENNVPMNRRLQADVKAGKPLGGTDDKAAVSGAWRGYSSRK